MSLILLDCSKWNGGMGGGCLADLYHLFLVCRVCISAPDGRILALSKTQSRALKTEHLACSRDLFSLRRRPDDLPYRALLCCTAVDIWGGRSAITGFCQV